jgi:thiol-disulfide isomerase/thioredoxin
MTKKIVIVLAAIVAIAFGVLYGNRLLSVHQGMEPPPSLAALKLEKPPQSAPDVAFADGAGARHALSAFRGRFVLLNLWATWCAPCVAELPALSRLAAFAPGLRVLAINADTGSVDAAAFLKSHHVALPVFRDSDVTMLKSFKAYGLPMTVLIDPDGKIVARAEGPADWDNPEAVAYFKRITGS